MKSGGFQVKPYKFRCFNKNYSVWWMQERGYDFGFHEIWGHSPSMHHPPPNWRVFAETSEFIRFWVDFTWNPPDFMVKSAGFHEIHWISWIMSFCVMIKYRSFDFRKTNHKGVSVPLQLRHRADKASECLNFNWNTNTEGFNSLRQRLTNG